MAPELPEGPASPPAPTPESAAPEPPRELSQSEILEHAILGTQPTLDAVEITERTGASLDQVRRLWRALGFPESSGGNDYHEVDAEAVATLMGVVERGAIDFDTAVALTRALGQTMSRLADWEAATLVPRFEELEDLDNGVSRIDAAVWLLQEMTGPFEDLMAYAWRRHLAAAATRLEALGSADEDLQTTQVSVGFADIVAFTELSNSLEDEQIGDLVEVFESRCADVVSRYGGRVIKSIGDSVLFIADPPETAFEIANGVINVIGRDPRMPDVRLGLSSGSVVTRMGDVFGPPVNLAARLTGVARRNRIITDPATAAKLDPDRFETRGLAPRPLRGFGVVEPVAVRRR